MLKLLLTTILLIGFALSQNNFDPVEIQGYICFKPDEAFLIAQRLEKLSLLENKIIYYENLENSIDEFIKKDKRKKVKVFFNGVSVGSGITFIGGAGVVAVILLRLLL